MNPPKEMDFSPVLLIEIDLADPLPDLDWGQTGTGTPYSRAQILVRIHAQPIGQVHVDSSLHSLDPERVAHRIWEGLRPEINHFLKKNNLPEIDRLGAAGLSHLDLPGQLTTQSGQLGSASLVSVVVTTHDRPDSLEETLRSIARVDYPHFEIIIIDNAPSNAAAAELVERLSAELGNLRYMREDRPGLCWARNCGLQAAQGDLVVFTDDDVLVDKYWLAALVQGFGDGENVACVTGLILPRELDTPAQVWCEEHGGFGKGFAPQIYDLGTHRPDDPLFPYRLSMFGSGANMGFRTDILRQVGGCDPALGAGTPTRSAAEFPAFFNILTNHHQIVYRPDAIVYHSHHEQYTQFRRQFFGYGVGYTAFLTKIILEKPRILFDLIRRLLDGIYFLFSKQSPRHAKKQANYPKELNLLEILGMIYGPLAYFQSRAKVRKVQVTQKRGSD